MAAGLETQFVLSEVPEEAGVGVETVFLVEVRVVYLFAVVDFEVEGLRRGAVRGAGVGCVRDDALGGWVQHFVVGPARSFQLRFAVAIRGLLFCFPPFGFLISVFVCGSGLFFLFFVVVLERAEDVERDLRVGAWVTARYL